MRKSQANRAVIAARAPQSTPNHGRVGTDLLKRNAPLKAPVGAVRNRSALKGTPCMRSGDGNGRSLWTKSAELTYSLSAVANDRKWASTVTDHG